MEGNFGLSNRQSHHKTGRTNTLRTKIFSRTIYCAFHILRQHACAFCFLHDGVNPQGTHIYPSTNFLHILFFNRFTSISLTSSTFQRFQLFKLSSHFVLLGVERIEFEERKLTKEEKDEYNRNMSWEEHQELKSLKKELRETDKEVRSRFK
mgnify:CR=1 FL=1